MEGIAVGLDERLFYLINGMATQSKNLDWVMNELSQEGNLLFPIILLISYWAWTNWREARIAAPTLGLIFILGDFFGAQLKMMIARVRPWDRSTKGLLGVAGSSITTCSQ